MGVPRRAEHIAAMVGRLRAEPGAGEVTVVMDESAAGPWETWKRAWAARPPDTTVHVVLQDDVLTCSDFWATMRVLARSRPRAAVSGFLPRRSVDAAVRLDARWVRVRSFLWAQCVMLPVAMGDSFVAWIESQPVNPEWGWFDDTRLRAYLQAHGQPIWVPVPHPVEHVGHLLDGGSTLGHHFPAKGRVARAGAWRGPDTPLAALNWTSFDYVND